MFNILAKSLMTATQQDFIGTVRKPQKTRYVTGWQKCCRFISARARISVKSL